MLHCELPYAACHKSVMRSSFFQTSTYHQFDVFPTNYISSLSTGALGRLWWPSYFLQTYLRRSFMLPTQICGHWRRVAIMTPRLWASFVRPLAYKPMIEPDVALAKTWVSRAGQCPLSLHIEVMWTDDVLSMIDGIFLHFERWQHIKFVMPTDLIALLAVARHHLPLLETLSLQTGQIDYCSSRELDIFEFTPRLRCLRLNWGCSLDEISIPGAQLSHCSIDYADPEQCLYILARSRTLVKFETCLK